jgi:YD repeat-containing protein
MKYPPDYTGLTGTDAFTAGIKNLQDNNILAPVIEKYTLRMNSDGSDNRVMGGVITSYKASLPLPDTIWTTEMTKGATSFMPTAVSDGSITKSSFYKPQILHSRYDNTGNIIEQQKRLDMKKAYVWDYLGSYPIAECANADSVSIAFTSFEEDGSGNWTIGSSARDDSTAITGQKSYNLGNGNISKGGLTSGNVYIVSYWSTNGTKTISGASGSSRTGRSVGDWTYYEHTLTASSSTITLSGSGSIDELRLYPQYAQMTSYTYTPLIGMTTAADPNGEITYYEYDAFGRLQFVKDYNHNIVRNFKYNYTSSGH